MGKGTDQYDRMLNAGFCGITACALVEGSSGGSGGKLAPGLGFPLVSVYLLTPMVLHRKTAERIERSSDRGLAEFLTHYPDSTIGLEHRISITVSNIRAGLSLALARGALRFERSSSELIGTGVIKACRGRLRELLVAEDDRRVTASLKLGKWAAQMSLPQICNALSIRPVWWPSSSSILENVSQTAS